jgi:hypothetical protein
MKPKFLLFVGLLVALGVCTIIAQSIVMSGGRRWTPYQTYEPKAVPPLSLTDAYAIALAHMGAATNRLHCVSASCLEMENTNGFTGWTFKFYNTNGDQATMWVFFDRAAIPADERSGDLIFK